jgi:hypothetical protein
MMPDYSKLCGALSGFLNKLPVSDQASTPPASPERSGADCRYSEA